MGTKTSDFGVGSRESHDSTAFYARFNTPKTEDLGSPRAARYPNRLICGDSRNMTPIRSNSVALMVTSPPYHVGKEYDTDDSFDDYLDMLRDVFIESYRVLEPGGRAVINIANLGRKPYIPLTSYVDAICLDIGYLPRGQIIWQKAAGAGGNCAWGTWKSAQNPVLRDLHEYLLVYSKGRFDRAMKGESTITDKEFLEYTLSVWNVRPESAKKIGHPAPFPLEIPRRFIKLYTYKNDVVLDPFIGAGTTALAALQEGRRYYGYDNDCSYIKLAEDRIEKWRESNVN